VTALDVKEEEVSGEKLLVSALRVGSKWA